MIFVLKIIFFTQSLWSSLQFINVTKHINSNENNIEEVKEFNLYYAEESLNNRFKNATLLEFIWTIAPAIILILMAIPSFILLYAMEEGEWPMFNICAIGNQWYWTYEYMDFDVIKYYKIFIKELASLQVNSFYEFIESKNFKIFKNESVANEILEKHYKTCANRILDLYIPNNNELPNFFKKKWDFAIFPLFNMHLDDTSFYTLKNISYFENNHNYFSFFISKLIYSFNYFFDFFYYVLFNENTYLDIENSLEDTIIIDCQIIPESDLPKGYPRLLCTDQVLVIPTETTIRVLVTSNDVIHSWSLPSFGIKMDGIPGRINQLLLNTPFFGTVWGQCSELCGVNHGFMPIELRAIALPEFKEYSNLMILNSIEDINKTFINDHTIDGINLKFKKNNVLKYWWDFIVTSDNIWTVEEYEDYREKVEIYIKIIEYIKKQGIYFYFWNATWNCYYDLIVIKFKYFWEPFICGLELIKHPLTKKDIYVTIVDPYLKFVINMLSIFDKKEPVEVFDDGSSNTPPADIEPKNSTDAAHPKLSAEKDNEPVLSDKSVESEPQIFINEKEQEEMANNDKNNENDNNNEKNLEIEKENLVNSEDYNINVEENNNKIIIDDVKSHNSQSKFFEYAYKFISLPTSDNDNKSVKSTSIFHDNEIKTDSSNTVNSY
jgi:heme/copper-type cytochrome/quinol oxidase subunit 2